jgi:hypothetical protein
MRKFQAQFLFQVHLLKKVSKVKVHELLFKVPPLQHAKLVSKMNANVCSKKIMTAMRTREDLRVFKRELVTLPIHLLKVETKVKVQGINLPLIP